MKLTQSQKKQIQQEALSRAINPLGSLSNFPAIIQGFHNRGIPLDEIKPRENVFTFQAWKALGRHVKRGEHGIRVLTFRHEEVKEALPDGTEKTKDVSRPWSAIVFHISQTEPNVKESA
jgi:hypothetical protein